MAVAFTLITSCNSTPGLVEPNKPNTVNIEKIANEVGHGLNKIQIDDSTTILIYRGVESCTMIQLK